MINLQGGGWQVTVEYFKDYVIKTPNSKKVTTTKISEYLKQKNDLEKTDDLVDKIQKEWKNSIKIIKSSDIPLRLLAYPEFLKEGKVKQKRAVVLDHLFENLIKERKLNDAKKLMDQVLGFIIELWKYGLHEKTFKFYSGYGILDNRIVLIDFGEVTNNFEKVKKQLEKKGPKLDYLRKAYTDELIDYFLEQKEKVLTTKRLKKEWGKSCQKSADKKLVGTATDGNSTN